MELFKMAKEAFSMRSKIKDIDKKLRKKTITLNHKGVQIQVNGKSEFLSFNILDNNLLTEPNKHELEKQILEAFCEAHNQAQNIMTEEAKKLTGNIKLSNV
ncbi:MAG: YbaB/EbfC family nucleoid-associated protein [Endomicrobium sp.]|jgi:DNA-binding protein YbaB|nr:YbaB/EbfC family nucleoid-associated protein [Endomicrobium sp.]